MCRESWFLFMGIGKQRMARCKRSFHGKDRRSIAGPGGSLTYFFDGILHMSSVGFMMINCIFPIST